MSVPPVRIVTDSTADLPADLAADLGITVVPLDVRFGHEVFRDGIDLTPAQFLERLTHSPVLPTTSQPAVGLFVDTYRRLAPAPIVSVHIAARLSGTYNSAHLAAQTLDGEVSVTVLDSGQATMGVGWLAVLAARAARAGAGREEVVQVIQERIERVRLLALLDTLEFLRRGGRIGPAAAFLGTLLSIKPIIHVRDGQVLPLEKVRTRPRGLQRMAELAMETAPYEELAVLHSAGAETAQHLREQLGKIHPLERILVVEAGPVIVTHAGPGAVGIVGVRR